jgi:hypothetical protein
VDGGSGASSCKFIREVRRFKFVGGGYERATGERVTIPRELIEARTVDALCQRYHCLPSQLMAEDADWILHAHALMKEAGDDEVEEPNG